MVLAARQASKIETQYAGDTQGLIICACLLDEISSSLGRSGVTLRACLICSLLFFLPFLDMVFAIEQAGHVARLYCSKTLLHAFLRIGELLLSFGIKRGCDFGHDEDHTHGNETQDHHGPAHANERAERQGCCFGVVVDALNGMEDERVEDQVGRQD